MKYVIFLLFLGMSFQSNADCNIFESEHPWTKLEKGIPLSQSALPKVLEVTKTVSNHISQSLVDLTKDLIEVGGIPTNSNKLIVLQIDSHPALIAQARSELEAYRAGFPDIEVLSPKRSDVRIRFMINIRELELILDWQLKYISIQPWINYRLSLTGVDGIKDIFQNLGKYTSHNKIN